MILPVCKTFNKAVHKVLSKISVRLLACYLEKLKGIHQFLAIFLVLTSGEFTAKSIFMNLTIFMISQIFMLAVIHSVAHCVNAMNFVKNFDPELSAINWAKDKDDVSSLNFHCHCLN